MKYASVLVLSLVVLLLTGAAPEVAPRNAVSPACDAEKLCTQCVNQLPSDFSFVKSYPLDGEGGNKRKLEYSYVFTKGTLYRLNICVEGSQSSTDGIIVILYDSKRNAIATNLAGKDMTSSLTYSCNATGVYFIQFVLDKSTTFCGGSALGFKRE